MACNITIYIYIYIISLQARKVAQKHMSSVMGSYSYCYRLIIDDIVEGLKVDPSDENLRSIYQVWLLFDKNTKLFYCSK